MIDYCAEHDLDSTNLHVSEILEMMDAFKDHITDETKDLIFKTVKDGTR